MLVQLTGFHRGRRSHLIGGAVRVGTHEHADIRFPAGTAGVAPRHAMLIREPAGYVLWAEPQEAVFVDGERVEQHTLKPGEVVQIGHGGPILRYRVQDRPPGEYKTMAQALQDCADCARFGSERRLGRLGLLLGGIPRELLTQTAPTVRVLAAGMVTLLLVLVVGLAAYAVRLEHRLDEETRRLATIEAAVRDASVPADEGNVRELVSDLQTGLTQRIEALESRSEAGSRVVGGASGSIMLLQGAYGFRDPESDRVVRLVLGVDGRPQRAPWGGPMVSPDGEGPLLQKFFTGSAFLVVTGLPEDARLHTELLITNRHVVRPWEFDSAAEAFLQRDYRPNLNLIGFLPGIEEAFELEEVGVSESADLAVLHARRMAGSAVPLPLGEFSPRPGAEVIVMGYPTGFSALLARTNASFVDSLVQTEEPDFWEVARRLSAAGLVRPLATQGIVGQVTAASVVYDAETTAGGSGGPVLDLDGRVVAVTVGVMKEFGGSNLGVPVEEVRKLLTSLGPVRVDSADAGPDQAP